MRETAGSLRRRVVFLVDGLPGSAGPPTLTPRRRGGDSPCRHVTPATALGQCQRAARAPGEVDARAARRAGGARGRRGRPRRATRLSDSEPNQVPVAARSARTSASSSDSGSALLSRSRSSHGRQLPSSLARAPRAGTGGRATPRNRGSQRATRGTVVVGRTVREDVHARRERHAREPLAVPARVRPGPGGVGREEVEGAGRGDVRSGSAPPRRPPRAAARRGCASPRSAARGCSRRLRTTEARAGPVAVASHAPPASRSCTPSTRSPSSGHQAAGGSQGRSADSSRSPRNTTGHSAPGATDTTTVHTVRPPRGTLRRGCGIVVAATLPADGAPARRPTDRGATVTAARRADADADAADPSRSAAAVRRLHRRRRHLRRHRRLQGRVRRARASCSAATTCTSSRRRRPSGSSAPPTLEAISRNPVHTSVFDDVAQVRHVALGQAADLIVVAPATAHTLAKLAHGLSDDLLGTTVLASTAPLVVAPAMHTRDVAAASTTDNWTLLRARGVVVVGPDDGPLTGGDSGPGPPERARRDRRRGARGRRGRAEEARRDGPGAGPRPRRPRRRRHRRRHARAPRPRALARQPLERASRASPSPARPPPAGPRGLLVAAHLDDDVRRAPRARGSRSSRSARPSSRARRRRPRRPGADVVVMAAAVADYARLVAEPR